MVLDLSKITGNANGRLAIEISAQAIKEDGTQNVTVTLSQNIFNATANPQNSTQSQTFNYASTPVANIAKINSDLNLSSYISTGVTE